MAVSRASAGAVQVCAAPLNADPLAHAGARTISVFELNTVIISILIAFALSEILSSWGRLVESTVGAHLVNGLAGRPVDVLYWRHRNREVDFALRTAGGRTAIEVKSGRRRDALPGIAAYERALELDPGNDAAIRSLQELR